jgi:hypothetical protein
MEGDKQSRTEKEEWVEESLFNLGHHYKTTISNGDKKIEGRGRTSEEAERIASEKWDRTYGDDDDEDDDDDD